MKCAECGLPLSPSRTTCPRCGAPAGKTSGKIRLTRETAPTPPHTHVPVDIATLDRTPPVWPTLTPPLLPPSEPATVQEPFPETGAGFFSATAAPTPAQPQPDIEQVQTQAYDMSNTPPSSASYVPNTPSKPLYVPNTPSKPLAPEPYQAPTTGVKPTFAPPNVSTRHQPKTRLGFTIAAMCFTAGIIIMIFVFIMAQSLTPTNLRSSTAATNQPQTTSVQTPTVATPTPTNAQATPTLTPTLTSNQYINNVGLASSVDTTTGQALQTTKEFHVSQSIYVTMTIQQAAYTGAVCLDWVVNNQAYPYANSASPGGAAYLAQTNAYFYYSPGVTGTGSVNVSWASSIACTDKVLIQTLNFTVIP